ncbi:hypothetical protein A374_06491 [Fictibacillus macauensis ZFHKF-1]|uniref:Lipoprotein n=1 Tax=Fictibacillus macauensis ZFHKF-1 TaxID=1196324 RepID=I8J391_9BACL|nr:hypothetical protein [Fictibacillus macauensis]EIT86226.1 hypothetical protein A374_06491 [Fictibacillus macauensis ZFHKF-1]
MKRFVFILVTCSLLFSCYVGAADTAQAARKTSYLPSAKYTYSYESLFGDYTLRNDHRRLKGWNVWRSISRGKKTEFYFVKETRKGLFSLQANADDESLELQYPVKKGKKWKAFTMFGSKITYTIIATNKTVKTKAGTFHHVVQTRSSEGYTTSFAPNIGPIKITKKGYTYLELVKRKR